MTDILIPSLDFLSMEDIDWSLPSSELIRFRENTRPVELLEQPLFLTQSAYKKLVLIADPAAAHEILVKRTAAFPKSPVQQKLGKQAFGPGLSGTLGQRNERQRTVLKALVSAKQAEHVKEVSRVATSDAISRWIEMGTIDLYREMSELALQITWATLFGDNQYRGRDIVVADTIDALHKEDKSDFVRSAKVVSQLTQYFLDSGRWKILPLDNPLRAIASERGWESAPGLSAEEVKANALVFAASGHVTTGITLAWCGWLLGLHPDLQESIRSQSENDDGERRAVRNLIYESLRLFPPGTEVMRHSRESITVAGTEIAAGSMLFVSLYFLHRHKLLWDKPHCFNPHRFSPEQMKNIPKGAFMPFSGGDYGCSGMSVAWAEMMAVLTQCLADITLEVDPVDALNMKLEAGTCLYPGSALKCRITPIRDF